MPPPNAGIANVGGCSKLAQGVSAICSPRYDDLGEGVSHHALIGDDANKAVRWRGTSAHSIDVRSAEASLTPAPSRMAAAAGDAALFQLDDRKNSCGAARLSSGVQRDSLRIAAAYADVAAGIDDTKGRAVSAKTLGGAIDSVAFCNAAQIDP